MTFKSDMFILIFRTKVNHLFEGDGAMVEDSKFMYKSAYSILSIVGLNPINKAQSLDSD